MALGDVSLVIVRKEAGIWVVGAAQQGLQPELVLEKWSVWGGVGGAGEIEEKPERQTTADILKKYSA